MKRQFFSLAILLAFVLGMMAAPTGPAAADGAGKVYATYTRTSLCWDGTPLFGDPRCNYGEFTVLPNGKTFLTGWVDVVQFTASDPRWTVECVDHGAPFPPAGPVFPLMGSFVCTPPADVTDPTIQGGWWEGNLQQVAHGDKWISVFTARGYGTFEGLQAISRNSLSAHPYDVIEIIETGKYGK